MTQVVCSICILMLSFNELCFKAGLMEYFLSVLAQGRISFQHFLHIIMLGRNDVVRQFCQHYQPTYTILSMSCIRPWLAVQFRYCSSTSAIKDLVKDSLFTEITFIFGHCFSLLYDKVWLIQINFVKNITKNRRFDKLSLV